MQNREDEKACWYLMHVQNVLSNGICLQGAWTLSADRAETITNSHSIIYRSTNDLASPVVNWPDQRGRCCLTCPNRVSIEQITSSTVHRSWSNIPFSIYLLSILVCCTRISPFGMSIDMVFREWLSEVELPQIKHPHSKKIVVNLPQNTLPYSQQIAKPHFKLKMKGQMSFVRLELHSVHCTCLISTSTFVLNDHERISSLPARFLQPLPHLEDCTV